MTCNDTPQAGPTLLQRALAGLSALACAGALVACDDGERAPAGDDDVDDVDDAVEDDASLAAAPVVQRTTAFEVCPRHRVIAIGDPESCVANIGGWQGGPLFAGTLPPGLSGICQYTWSGEGTPVRAQLGEFTRVDSDCEVDWPQGDALGDLLGPDLRDAFYTRLGPAAVPLGAGSVMVALPDTASTSTLVMNSDHAANMAGIIDSVACDGGVGCTVTVAPHVALPLLAADEPADFVQGGYRGSQGQLALALHAAVAQWSLDPDAPRLIVNLSVGWDAAQFGGQQAALTAMPAPVQAVVRTLEYARCRGALIVAAAGNIAGDAPASGPLAPALWEARPAPNAAVCGTYGGAPGWDPSSKPLVYAVGGVDYLDRPLMNARPAARPRLAAPAFAAVADGAGGLTGALTGSSVAAAVVSGIAARVWARDKHLGPDQVMARIYDGGVGLGATADFGPSQQIRRASLCGALAQPCPPMTVDLVALGAAAEDAAAALASAQWPAVVVPPLTHATVCDAVWGQTLLHTATAPADVCETDLVAGRDRYTDPQPSEAGCSVCFVSNGKVSMTVDAEFSELAVNSAVLEVLDGVNDQRYQLGPIFRLSSSFATEVVLPAGVVADPNLHKAMLHLDFATRGTFSNVISLY